MTTQRISLDLGTPQVSLNNTVQVKQTEQSITKRSEMNAFQNTARLVTLDTMKKTNAKIRVVGVGGAGCNAVESMIKRGLNGVEFVAVNTDAQVLEYSNAHYKIQVGDSTRGLGAGAKPEIGKKAVEDDRDKINEVLQGSDMVFIAAGMGGGTGTGGAPVIASIAKSLGALVIGIVTKPFTWEGRDRAKNAEQGLAELRQHVDSLIVVPNSRLLNIIERGTPANQALDKANEILYDATRAISDIITIRGLVNVDFADVRTVMQKSGLALMGCGLASGENRAIDASQKAISSPLLDGMNIKGAKSILINVTSSSNFTWSEFEEGSQVISSAAGEEANIIFGYVINEDMNDYVSFTVIATGFDHEDQNAAKPYTLNAAPVQVKPQVPTQVKQAPANTSPIVIPRHLNMNDISTPTFIRNQFLKQNEESAEEEQAPIGLNLAPPQPTPAPAPKPQQSRRRHDDDDEESSSFLNQLISD